jgi:hypothetical protein
MRLALLAFVALAACAPEAVSPSAPQTPAAEAPASAPLAEGEIPAPVGEITISSPLAGARVSSPLLVEGIAINNWMFEGVFPAELAVDGAVIAQAPAQQQAPDNWTNPGPVRFKAELAFTVTEEKNAVLILREDSPRPVSADSDVAGPARTVRIPVTLLPMAQ